MMTRSSKATLEANCCCIGLSATATPFRMRLGNLDFALGERTVGRNAERGDHFLKQKKKLKSLFSLSSHNTINLKTQISFLLLLCRWKRVNRMAMVSSRQKNGSIELGHGIRFSLLCNLGCEYQKFSISRSIRFSWKSSEATLVD